MKRSTSLTTAHSRGFLDRLVFESQHSNGGGHPERCWKFRLCQIAVLAIRLITPFCYLYLATLLSIYYYNHELIEHLSLGELKKSSVTFFSLITNSRFLVFSAFTTWAVLEALFFPYYYFLFVKLSHAPANGKHFAKTPEERERFANDCFDALLSSGAYLTGEFSEDTGKLYLQRVIEGWFFGVPINQIKYGDVMNWLAWAFFGRDKAAFTHSEMTELAAMAESLQHKMGYKFLPGETPDMKSARLTLDPVFTTQRPFFFYAVLVIVNCSAHALVFLLGYNKCHNRSIAGQSIYHRVPKSGILYHMKAFLKPVIPSKLLDFFSSNAANEDASNQESANTFPVPSPTNPKLPLVFIHGLGIGFAHYLSLLATFPEDVDVILIEWHHVSMQMNSCVPSKADTVQGILSILDDLKHEKACLMGHSLGSTAISWMLRDSSTSGRVASTILLDPVNLLLCDHTVATSVIYHDPLTPIEFLLHFFLARELNIAYTISRHFEWSQNILFVEELPISQSASYGNSSAPSSSTCSSSSGSTLTRRRKAEKVVAAASAAIAIEDDWQMNQQLELDSDCGLTDSANNVPEKKKTIAKSGICNTIILSTMDGIVPTSAVDNYLKSKVMEGHTSFELLLFDGYHGEMMLSPKWVGIISKKVRERCSL